MDTFKSKLNLFKNYHLKRLLLFALFFIKLINSQSLENFRRFHVENNNYYFVTSKEIIFYKAATQEQNSLKSFNSNEMLSEEELEYISFECYINQSKAPLCLLLIKNTAYALQKSGGIACSLELTEIKDYYTTFVYPVKCTATNCYFMIGVRNSGNKLNLYMFGNEVYSCNSEKYSSLTLEGVSDNLSCHLNQPSTNEDKLICFYENNSKELIAINFSLDLDNRKIIQEDSKSKPIDGAKIIESYLSSDKSDSVACYINDDNNCNCLKYNLNSRRYVDNSMNNKIYLEGCSPNFSSLNLEYYDTLGQFLLYCQQSSNKYSIIKLNSDFEIIDGEEFYELNEEEFENCNEYSISSLTLDQNGKVQIIASCGGIIGQYDALKVILPPTTILTTILTTTPSPLTTILNDIKPNYPLTTIIKIDSTLISISTIESDKIEIIQENCDKSMEDIINNLSDFMKNYDDDKIYEIFGDNYKVKISPLNERTYKDISTFIDMKNCENILRQNDEFSSSNFSLFQIEIFNLDESSLINGVEYSLFNEKNEKIDLSVCKDETIKIHYQIKNESFINTTKINYYAEQGIDVFDNQAKFFNDICYPYSEGDSDMILKDRISDIYENYSVCENNCNYEGINATSGTITCSCSIKTEVDTVIEMPEIYTVILDTFTDSNFGVIKCYSLVFKTDKLDNIGFWIFTILVLCHIPIFILYFIHNINPIQKYITDELKKFNYLISAANPIKNKNGKISEKTKKIKVTDNNEIKIYKKKKLDGSNVKSEITNNLSFSKNISSVKIPNLNQNNINSKQNLNKKENRKKDNNPVLLVNYKVLNKNYINIVKKEKNQKNKSKKDSPEFTQKKPKKNKIKFTPDKYFLIQIDADNSFPIKPPNSHIILDNYQYETAIKYDNRSILRIFMICLLSKEFLINLIFFKNPLILKKFKILLFFFAFSSDLALNSLFYFNENISKKYKYEGNNVYLFTLVNNLVESFTSAIVSLLLVNFFQFLVDSRGNYEEVFRKEESKMRKNRKYKVDKKTKSQMFNQISEISKNLKIKVVVFFALEFSLMLFYYYFVTAFCEVYKKTQVSWIIDFLTSYLLSILTEIILTWLLTLFYIVSIRYKIKFVYTTVLFIYNF